MTDPAAAAPIAEAPKAAPAAPAAEAPKAAEAQKQAAPATDGKAVDAGKEAPKADSAPQGAPEKYEFKAPEGTQYDAALIAPYSEVAKELGLPQDKAQTMIDKMAPKLAEVQQAQYAALIKSWDDEAQNDPEIGGPKLAENAALAQKAYHIFGTPKMEAILKQTGLGNNIEFIRMFARVGKAISEDNRFVRGGQAGPTTDQSAAAQLYPKQTATK